jgi:sec-independent protein translocase protein TatA
MLSTTELILILVIVVVVFGVGKLPQVGKQLGEGIKNFKKEMGGADPEDEEASRAELPPAEDQPVTPRDVTEEHKQNSR